MFQYFLSVGVPIPVTVLPQDVAQFRALMPRIRALKNDVHSGLVLVWIADT